MNYTSPKGRQKGKILDDNQFYPYFPEKPPWAPISQNATERGNFEISPNGNLQTSNQAECSALGDIASSS